MIRDPSDGSTRDAPIVDRKSPPIAPAEPTPEQLRLQRSREWLADYHRRKGCPQKSEQTVVSGLAD